MVRAAALLDTPRILDDLMARPWLGNVRELRNYIERFLAVGADAAPIVAPPPIDSPIDDGKSYKTSLDRVVDAFERRYLTELIARHGRNVTELARRAGIDRSWVHQLLRKHGL